MATRKTAEPVFPEDRLTELLADVEAGRRAAAEAEKRLKEHLAAETERLMLEVVYPAMQRQAESEYRLLRHVGKARRRFFPIGKTVKRRTGSVQRRWNPPAVDFSKRSAEEALKRALEGEHYRFVRWSEPKPFLDLKAIQAEPELALELIGVGISQEEDVRITTPISKASYAVRGREALNRLNLARRALSSTETA